MEYLLDPSGSLLDRGLALWLTGRIVQLDAATHRDKASFKEDTLRRSSQIMSAALEIVGLAKRVLRNRNAGSNPKRLTREENCNVICKNGSILVMILTEVGAEEEVRELSPALTTSFFRMRIDSSCNEEVSQKETPVYRGACGAIIQQGMSAAGRQVVGSHKSGYVDQRAHQRDFDSSIHRLQDKVLPKLSSDTLSDLCVGTISSYKQKGKAIDKKKKLSPKVRLHLLAWNKNSFRAFIVL